MELFWLDLAQRGRLATATRPRGGDWLDDVMRDLVAHRVRLLVSMLTPIEESELDLQGERTAALAAGLEMLNIPIADRGLPERLVPFREGAQTAAQIVRGGGDVVVHCRMGIGRSSMFAAATLFILGVELNDGWTRIARVRGRPVPDVPAQRDWLETVAPLLR